MTGWRKWSTGNCAKNIKWPYEQVVYTQPRILPGNWDAQTSSGFCDTIISPNLDQTARPTDSQQKRKKKEKKNLPNSRLCSPGKQQNENKRKWKER